MLVRMLTYTNDEWLQALSQPGKPQQAALETLRDYLLRAVLVYLRYHRSDVSSWSSGDIHQFAEDAVQEALMAIRKKLDTFRGESKFTTWAYRFAVNKAASELRRSRYLDTSLDSLQDGNENALKITFSDRRVVDPDAAAEQRSFMELLSQIIGEELSERQQRAVVGIHIQGRSMQEVAEELDITRNTLYKLLHDARRKIKERLQARYLTVEDVLAIFE